MEINSEIIALPFTEYLNETYHNVRENFSALKWLQYLDTDSFNMLYKYVYNFDESTPMEDINENDVLDMFKLVRKIVAFESSMNLDCLEAEHATAMVQNFCILITIERLRKKGLVSIHGSGKLAYKETSFKLTKQGKLARAYLKTNKICAPKTLKNQDI